MLLEDISVCRYATIFLLCLKANNFTVPPTDDKKKTKEEKKDHTKKDPETQAVSEILQFNMIDGGIAVNNPVGFSSGLFSSTFYDYKSIFKTYISSNCHNLGYLVWS
jgi:negative regulator of genetic competence, sporulation and motility